MAWIDEEQVKLAKEVDLLTYLQHNEPHELVKSKYRSDEYRTATHSSLVISKGLWFHNRTRQGGKSAIDFLIKMRGIGFLDAVETVLGARGIGYAGISQSSPDSAVGASAGGGSTLSALSVEGAEIMQQAQLPLRPEFILPETALLPSNATNYLQKRGISPEVINRCLSLGILAETKKYQNVVFIGRDEDGKARFACLRGTRDGFKCDVRGSYKRYSFYLPPKNSDIQSNKHSRHLACFEAPMDLLSHATLQQRGGLVASEACCSTMQPEWNWDGHRLSLGGISSVALISFLERSPQITRVMLHLDNDAAGLAAMQKIKEQLGQDSRFKHIRVSINPPRGAKDYNEILLRAVTAEREQKQLHKNQLSIR